MGTTFFAAVLVTVFLNGCTRGFPIDESSEPKARVTVADFVSRVSSLKGFIAPAEMVGPEAAPSELAPDAALKRLLKSARIYNFDPREYAYDQGTDCIAESMSGLRFKATRTTLLLQGSYDDSACVSSSGQRVKSTNQIYVAIACTGASFYSYDGRTPTSQDLRNLSADQLCPEGNFAILTNTVSEVSPAPLVKKPTEFLPSRKTTTTVMTRDGSACTFVVRNGLRQSLNECTEITVETLKPSPEQTQTSIYSEKYDDLTAQMGGQFFIGGVKKVSMENWTGTISFVGPNIPPAYEISNGQKVIKGEFAGLDSSQNWHP